MEQSPPRRRHQPQEKSMSPLTEFFALRFCTLKPTAIRGDALRTIDPAGTITGYYYDARAVAHGFLRSP